MRFFASHCFAAARLVAAAAALAIAVGPTRVACGATLPRYGGTLVVELHEPALVLDPLKWKPGAAENAANEQIATAVFDHLVTLDRFGRFQPGLATEWSHDAAWRRWKFTLRQGVQFSDGSALTSANVAAALQELLSRKVAVTAANTQIVMQFAAPAPDLLEQLASQRYLIFRRNADGTLLGTGPFFVVETAAALGSTGTSRYKLLSNEHCWAGRPFVDGVEVNVGVPALRQLFDLQLGKADVVEISPELVRRAGQENLRVWASAPVLLYALQVSAGGGSAEASASQKPRIGEALSLAMDRATLASVLLQKQAEPAASFLPQWLSGYAFVFGMESDVARAKEMSSAMFAAPGGASIAGAAAQPLHLRMEGGGDLAKLIAERVAINARQAGIAVQVQTHGVTREAAANAGANSGRAPDTTGLRLVAWRYSSLSERAELDAMVTALQLEPLAEEKAVEEAEQLYAREKRLVAEHNLIPLVVLPEYIGLGAAVRDWMPERWGEWHLADVWLDGKRGISAAGSPR